MEKLNTKQIMINFMVKSMLNPSNKSFYIGSLTLDKLNRIINSDSEMSEIIWTAYHIAENKYREKCAFESLIQKEYNPDFGYNSCPECGCTQSSGYIPNVACPNCDYVEV